MSVISGIVGAITGNKAANAQADAAKDSAAIQKQIYDQAREDYTPFREAGYNALGALNFELGLGPRPMIGGSLTPQQFASAKDRNALADAERAKLTDDATLYGGFTKTPGYDFRRQEGTNAIQASAAARGGLNSGATLKALSRFGQDYAANEYGNYLNRLAGMAGIGQTATGAVAGAGQNYAAGAGQALQAAGAARASGYNATGQGVQNALGGIGQIAGFGYGQGWFG